MVAGGLYWLFRQPSRAGLTLLGWAQSPSGLAALALLVGVIGLVVLGILLLSRLRRWLEAEIEADRLHREGESRVAGVVQQTLDGKWTLFRDLRLNGRGRACLDAVLVGPPGVWALDIQNWSGIYRNTGDRWEIRQGQSWKACKKSPSRQARSSAARLKSWLKAGKIKAPVDCAVVWADQENPLLVEDPSVDVWPLERLADELGNLWREEELPPELRDRIVEKLAKLCEQRQERKSEEPKMVPRPGAIQPPSGED